MNINFDDFDVNFNIIKQRKSIQKFEAYYKIAILYVYCKYKFCLFSFLRRNAKFVYLIQF